VKHILRKALSGECPEYAIDENWGPAVTKAKDEALVVHLFVKELEGRGIKVWVDHDAKRRHVKFGDKNVSLSKVKEWCLAGHNMAVLRTAATTMRDKGLKGHPESPIPRTSCCASCPCLSLKGAFLQNVLVPRSPCAGDPKERKESKTQYESVKKKLDDIYQVWLKAKMDISAYVDRFLESASEETPPATVVTAGTSSLPARIISPPGRPIGGPALPCCGAPRLQRRASALEVRGRA